MILSDHNSVGHREKHDYVHYILMYATAISNELGYLVMIFEEFDLYNQLSEFCVLTEHLD